MPTPLSYDLHKLGWRAFQDLTAVILQTALGQTFHSFADSNDGGRDGAFFGRWALHREHDQLSIPRSVQTATATVAQCKFSVKSTGTLTPAALKGELAKIKDLRDRGLCDAYILVTNLRVSGATEAWLLEELRALGVPNGMALDGEWISQQISRRPDLRRYVPRVYGLGDLGQILDDRRLQQATALMSRLGEDLATFVPTAAYKQAADALAEHGFTLLLGAPAAGKSTIAATLSMAALDEWGAGVRRVDSAAEMLASWNPHEPNQLFWVDDAFGSIRHDDRLTDDWSRRLDQVMTAISAGAKLILTSRDYIYRQARPHLKEYAYPLLREQAVVVDVAKLTIGEKERILYNHLKAGDQTAATLRSWKPRLAAVSASPQFQPEVARRLGLKAFTEGAIDSGTFSLSTFVEHPVEFLRDVLGQLDSSGMAAMACVFMAGDGLPVPVELTDRESEAVDLLGAVQNQVVPALRVHQGTFLALSVGADGSQQWTFRHPTIREAFASHIASDPNLVKVLIQGMTDEELHRQIDCGANERGTLVTVPPSLYSHIIARSSLAANEGVSHFTSPLSAFLERRCSDAFLRMWADVNRERLHTLLDFGSYMSAYWQPRVLGRLAEAGALPDSLRTKAVTKISDMAINDFDADWLAEPIASLFDDEERSDLIARVEDESLTALENQIHQSADGYAPDVSYADRYARARETVEAYIELFADDADKVLELEAARESIDYSVNEHDGDPDFERERERDSLSSRLDGPLLETARDAFDDVDAGHS